MMCALSTDLHVDINTSFLVSVRLLFHRCSDQAPLTRPEKQLPFHTWPSGSSLHLKKQQVSHSIKKKNLAKNTAFWIDRVPTNWMQESKILHDYIGPQGSFGYPKSVNLKGRLSKTSMVLLCYGMPYAPWVFISLTCLPPNTLMKEGISTSTNCLKGGFIFDWVTLSQCTYNSICPSLYMA